jgi:hypothetical protein
MHAPCGIQTHNPSKQAAADTRLRPRGQWHRHFDKLYAGKTTKRTSVIFSISLLRLWQDNSLRHMKLSSMPKRLIFPIDNFLACKKTPHELLNSLLLRTMTWDKFEILKYDFRRCAPNLRVHWMTVTQQNDMPVMYHLSNMTSGA